MAKDADAQGLATNALPCSGATAATGPIGGEAHALTSIENSSIGSNDSGGNGKAGLPGTFFKHENISCKEMTVQTENRNKQRQTRT